MRKISLLLILAVLLNVSTAQSVKDYMNRCNLGLLDTRFDSTNATFIAVRDNNSNGKMFLFHCSKISTLYGLPILKSVFRVVETDTIDAIKIFLPFDSSVVVKMEADLGLSELAWTAMKPGTVDKSHLTWDRHWFVGKYTVSFTCRKYAFMAGDEDNDDIVISISQRVTKQ